MVELSLTPHSCNHQLPFETAAGLIKTNQRRHLAYSLHTVRSQGCNLSHCRLPGWVQRQPRTIPTGELKEEVHRAILLPMGEEQTSVTQLVTD